MFPDSYVDIHRFHPSFVQMCFHSKAKLSEELPLEALTGLRGNTWILKIRCFEFSGVSPFSPETSSTASSFKRPIAMVHDLWAFVEKHHGRLGLFG